MINLRAVFRLRQIRSILLTLSLGSAIIALLDPRIGIAPTLLLFIGIAVCLIFTYLFFAAVYEANSRLKKGNLAEAERIIAAVPTKGLPAKQAARYHFVQGLLAVQRQEMDGASLHFAQALELPLNNSNDRGLVLLHLIKITYEAHEHPKALAYFHQLKETTMTDLRLKEQRDQWGNILKIR